jgi:hypothetical protein
MLATVDTRTPFTVAGDGLQPIRKKMPKKYTNVAKRREFEAALLAQAPPPIVEYTIDGECVPVISFHFKGRSAKACVDALIQEFEWSPEEALIFYSDNVNNPACQ